MLLLRLLHPAISRKARLIRAALRHHAGRIAAATVRRSASGSCTAARSRRNPASSSDIDVGGMIRLLPPLCRQPEVCHTITPFSCRAYARIQFSVSPCHCVTNTEPNFTISEPHSPASIEWMKAFNRTIHETKC
ncbi:MAG: hypothetical protein K0Q73_6649 [Paenibacillus sp.]|nr:hypothetical protein [Paenibacillus sp.]